MGVKFIKPEEMGIEIAQALKDYTDEVKKAIEDEIEATSKEIREDVERFAPKKTGKYSEGFAIKKVSSMGETKRIIYNKAKPGLTHLLEVGHMKSNKKGKVDGRPHLRPAYDKHVPKMEKRIQRIIETGGK